MSKTGGAASCLADVAGGPAGPPFLYILVLRQTSFNTEFSILGASPIDHVYKRSERQTSSGILEVSLESWHG